MLPGIYGGSFGQRTMVQSYAVLVFPLAAFVDFISQKKWLLHLTVPIVLFLIWLNVFQTWQTHEPYLFEAENMTEAYYWRVFGKTKHILGDRFLLDMDTDFKGERKEVVKILIEDFENLKDTTNLTSDFAQSGQYAIYVSPSKEFSHTTSIDKTPEIASKKWIRIKGSFYIFCKIWDIWKMPQLSLRIENNNNNKIVDIKALKPGRVLEGGQWKDVWMDVDLSNYEYDGLKIYLFSNEKSHPMYMDDLEVEIYND
ncbi:MAG: hypothetical protein ACI9XO_000190 [Paraglaciecola sp.]